MYRAFGCHQGSCLGPLLWLIIADHLIKRFTLNFEDILSYADDFVVIAYGDTRNDLEHNMNDKLHLMNLICQDLSLTISKEKCVSMLFGRFTLDNRHPIFKIDRVTVMVKDNIIYLGFQLDGKFNWIGHFERIREKIRNFTSNVRKTKCRDKGLHANFRKTWYNQVIEKQICYGFEIWFPDLHVHALRKLSSCQRLGLLSIISTYKTVSTDALCTLTGIPPIHIKLKHEFRKYETMFSNASIQVGDCIINSTNIMRNLTTSYFPSYNDINNLNFTEKSDLYFVDLGLPVIYTDGSKMESGVGAAFTTFHGRSFIYDFKISLDKHNLIYQAELSALKYAIDWSLHSDFQKI